MNTPKKDRKAVTNNELLYKQLSDAMKQPGVATLTEMVEAVEKYNSANAVFNQFIYWDQFPTVSTSCNTTELA